MYGCVQQFASQNIIFIRNIFAICCLEAFFYNQYYWPYRTHFPLIIFWCILTYYLYNYLDMYLPV